MYFFNNEYRVTNFQLMTIAMEVITFLTNRFESKNFVS